ncbi:DcaP family trimeric outer membrane transporter [Aliiglaciecola sp. CAU 1673]|uniref:DcaP family trimeric outer membrane transporter n=1 Tax=Aliiglaciecola sp. CAU 1673 TaxID=3032595 RepID=UPI0023DB60CB|nr:DcaP family trimeric outer membrane transporter [Aliiglaciecola sp. CAU 1673]MDF2178122.1 DcaP family trimeric outer membrane transporter [Aliiglaciecola sp. CAU 1673]
MKTQKTALSLALLGAFGIAHADVLDSTKVQFGGYIKLDAMASQYSDGSLSSGNIGRDFYIPGLTPVGGADEGTTFDMHARQTRFSFASQTALANGKELKSKIELDFMATPNGDERVSNSYSPRMRIATIEYDGWLFGQTWTTFQDVAVLPESLDFIGTTDGTIFVRQAMVRYTYGGFSVALENPETTVTPYGGGGRIVTDDNSVPDLVLRYTHKASWGHVSGAALVRQLAYDDGSSIDTTETAAAFSLSAKINLGKDDLRLMYNAGSGMGRYLGINTANGAVLNASGELESIDSSGGSIAYRHVWNEQWRSTLSYAFFSADNDVALTGSGVTKDTQSMRVNAIFSPTPELSFGLEYSHAEREIESGLDGDMDRLQFSAKYSF